MSDIEPDPERQWHRATLAAACLALNPLQIGGVNLRAVSGPLRDAWIDLYTRYAQMLRADRRDVLIPVPCHVDEERLLGGLDLTATLASGKPVTQTGLLHQADGRTLLLRMAERLDPRMAAHIAAVRDLGTVIPQTGGDALPARFGIVACDEGLDDTDTGAASEATPDRLRDRLGVWLDLNRIGRLGSIPSNGAISHDVLVGARDRLSAVKAAKEDVAMLVAAASAFGVDGVRAPMQALATARCFAALRGEDRLDDDDLMQACQLVFAPRATQLPLPPEDADAQEPPDTEPEDTDEQTRDESNDGSRRADMLEQLVEASKACLPPSLLADISGGIKPAKQATSGPSAAGVQRKAAQRGRRLRALAKAPAGTPGRLDILATLRAAVPLQTLRKTDHPGADPASLAGSRLIIRKDDFRYQRFKDQSDSCVIVCVDASGSSALHRLAEAKGAVELLLADAYARRDHVALIGFRGSSADMLLPPTRSLARAKRLLSRLPGGGTTPLASAIERARELALSAQRKGQTPLVVFLTDGKANVDLEGIRDRSAAARDAELSARKLAVTGVAACLIDTAPRPSPSAQQVADAMGARYVALPHASAQGLSSAIRREHDHLIRSPAE